MCKARASAGPQTSVPSATGERTIAQKSVNLRARCHRIGRVEGKEALDADRTGARKSLTAKPEECPTLPGCVGDCAAQV